MNMLRCLFLITALILSFQVAVAEPADYPGARGKPFEAIQDQVNALEASVDAQLAEFQAQLEALEAQVIANSEDISALVQWQQTQD